MEGLYIFTVLYIYVYLASISFAFSPLCLFSDLLGVAEERTLGAEVGELYILLRVRLLQKVVIQMCRLLLRLACATDAF